MVLDISKYLSFTCIALFLEHGWEIAATLFYHMAFTTEYRIHVNRVCNNVHTNHRSLYTNHDQYFFLDRVNKSLNFGSNELISHISNIISYIVHWPFNMIVELLRLFMLKQKDSLEAFMSQLISKCDREQTICLIFRHQGPKVHTTIHEHLFQLMKLLNAAGN